MNFLPEKYSPKWGLVELVYTAAIFSLIVLAQTILHTALTAKSLSSFALIAFVTALIGTIGGWLGGRIFFAVYSAGLTIGVAYMMYIAVANASPGWGDLTSLIGFVFILAFGTAGGLAAEGFSRWRKSKSRSK